MKAVFVWIIYWHTVLAGLVLYSSDNASFNAVRVRNEESSHCAMWTQPECQGTLYVVPAHYEMEMPKERFASVIC
ncbi:hypothetical protein BY458DRAFT_555895 [Sporodiniella umbellata]|nr:hypothetical protein BY458DRAFT_555895 [Sporodiniella umbellata]